MANIVYNILEEYNILNKLQCITTDNASNNYTMTRVLSQKLRDEAGVEWDDETQHLPCLAHIINLLVKNLLNAIRKKNPRVFRDDLDDDDFLPVVQDLDMNIDDPPEADGAAFRDILAIIGRLATSLRRSTTRWKIFQAACKSYDIEPMTIPLAMEVRFSSHYRQLLTAIYLRRPIRRYIDDAQFKPQEKHLYELSDEQWELAEFLVLFLRPFQRCTERFECNESKTEIDYVFFAYDSLYNHLEDVEEKLSSGDGIGALSCAPFLLSTLQRMKTTLSKYYSRTGLQTAYIDAMILNPRTKLVIGEEESWKDVDVDEYRQASRRRFVDEYDKRPENTEFTSNSTTSTIQPLSSSKHSRPSLAADGAYLEALFNRSAKRRRNDFDRYIEVPNDPAIADSLSWWRENRVNYPSLAVMARDALSVPASGCTVERVFSISGRLASWQRNRLNPDTISQTMMYKYAMTKTSNPLRLDEPLDDEDTEVYQVSEKEGHVPEEWIDSWWETKLDKLSVVRTPRSSLKRTSSLENSDEDDIYG